MHLNTEIYFSEIDATDAVRSDQAEGTDQNIQLLPPLGAGVNVRTSDGGVVHHPAGKPLLAKLSASHVIQLPDFASLTIRNADRPHINILCMYAYNITCPEPIDTRNLEFGDSAIVLTDKKEFIRRIEKAAKVAGKALIHEFVESVSRISHNGEMGPFRKFDSFDYQNEFRFVLAEGNGKPTVLKIGDIRDITSVHSSDMLMEILSPKP